MSALMTLYAWLSAPVMATADDGNHSVSLITILIVLAIVALLVFIFGRGWWRGRGE